MPKAVISLGTAFAQEGAVFVPYTGETDAGFGFGHTFQIDFTQSVANNLANLRSDVVSTLGKLGVVLTSADVVVLGGPS
jgi:hypothetical protein